jgi:DNA-binding transcriptional regulator LsrR (DeoR family)
VQYDGLTVLAPSARIDAGGLYVAGPDDVAELDQQDLLVTAAVLYYNQNRSQDQIARELGVSRPTVSRLLARAREAGIVRIEIVPPAVDPKLGPALRDRLGLRAVHIAIGTADAADPGPILSGATDRALTDVGLKSGDVILVSWGRAVHSLARCLFQPHPGVLVVPALGGSEEDHPWFQLNEIARQFAVAIRGVPRYLHAPAYTSPSLKRSLLRESSIRATLDLWQSAAVALVGVGNWPKGGPRIAAFATPTDDPVFDTAVGDVAGRFFREDGSLVRRRDESRLLGITADQLRGTPHVIAVAVGADKAKAIVGASCAELITTLITDAPTARAIAERLDQTTASHQRRRFPAKTPITTAEETTTHASTL